MNDVDSRAERLPDDETRMRQALGLGGYAPEQRPTQRDADRRPHRFVKEGEVPVVFRTAPRDRTTGASISNDRIAAAEEPLKAERAARERAERSLNEALVVVQQLRTKLGHAELAHQEALAAERRLCEQAERALQGVNAERGSLEFLLAKMSARASRAVSPDIAPSSEPTAPAASVKPGRKARASEPVQWWLPGYKGKLHKP